jgi:hypothetical protein
MRDCTGSEMVLEARSRSWLTAPTAWRISFWRKTAGEKNRMVRSTWLAMGVALTALAQVDSAQAQIVHKCVVNGNAVYQAAACPPAGEEKSLVIPPPPSQQELLEATANARLQNYHASTGTIASPAQRRYANRNLASPTLTPSLQEAQQAPRNNCEALNQSFHDGQYRRAELSAPGVGATRAEALQRVNDDLKRIAEQANTAHCRLR